MSEMLSKILDTLLGYGALGAIVTVALYVFVKRDEANAKYNKERDELNNKNFSLLITNLMNTNKENILNIQNGLMELSKSIQSNSNLYVDNKNSIEKELLKFKQQLLELNKEMMDNIIDNKKLSKCLFYRITHLIIRKEVYASIIDFYDFISDTSFYETDFINLLQYNINDILILHKNKMQQEVSKLNYNKEDVEGLIRNLEVLMESKQISIEKYIYENVDLDTILRENNLKNLKKAISSKLNNYIDKIEEELR